MKRDTHRYLDGEIPRDALSPEQLEEATAWDDALEVARLRRLRAPTDLEARILHALPGAEPGRATEPGAPRARAEAPTSHPADVLVRTWR
ncbi:MAG: hypothetical protein ACOC8B_02715, partial [Gemmatimonadota bacterium]